MTKRTLSRLILTVLALGYGCVPALAQSNPSPMEGGTSPSSVTRFKGYVQVDQNGIYTGDGKLVTLPAPGANSTVVTTTGNANGQVAKAETLSYSLNGSGANGVLGTSSTIQFVQSVGEAGTITKLSASAVTKPTATSSVTVQFFKNTTGNAICSVFDLNGVTSGALSTIPITGNSSLAAGDIIICQVVTGASLNSAAGCVANCEFLKSDY